jgi:hypothetical protein
MNQSLKAMMVAGMVAIALPALTGAADAQPVAGQWNYLTLSSCTLGTTAVVGQTGTYTYLNVSAYGFNTSSGMYNYLVPTFSVLDERQAIVLAQFCQVGASIVAYYSGPNSNPAWGPFEFYPFLNAGVNF